MVAIAMTVNAFKTRALFDGKVKELPLSNYAPEPPPGKT